MLCSCQGVRKKRTSSQFPVMMAKGYHLFPYRTQKLSPSAPMVLGWTRPGRVGRCRNPDREAWMRNLRASLFLWFWGEEIEAERRWKGEQGRAMGWGEGEGAHGRGSGCGLREFRASADARVPFPQGKGTKGCRGPARIPCGAPAPGPPADKYLVSVEPRRGAPDGVPFGSALTAPLKTFRFQRWACA